MRNVCVRVAADAGSISCASVAGRDTARAGFHSPTRCFLPPDVIVHAPSPRSFCTAQCRKMSTVAVQSTHTHTQQVCARVTEHTCEPRPHLCALPLPTLHACSVAPAPFQSAPHGTLADFSEEPAVAAKTKLDSVRAVYHKSSALVHHAHASWRLMNAAHFILGVSLLSFGLLYEEPQVRCVQKGGLPWQEVTRRCCCVGVPNPSQRVCVCV